MNRICAIAFVSQIISLAIKGFDILAIIYNYYSIRAIDSRTNYKKEKTNQTKSQNSDQKVSHIKIESISDGRDLD